MYNYTPSFYSLLQLQHLPFQPHQKQRHQRVPRSCDTHLFETQRAIIPTPLFSSRGLRVCFAITLFKIRSIVIYMLSVIYTTEDIKEVEVSEDIST